MPLKIKPNAIEQDEGHFILPGVVSLQGLTEFSFRSDLITGSSAIQARDTSSGFLTPILIQGNVIQFSSNDQDAQVLIAPGQFNINPTARDINFQYRTDDGTVLIHGDAGENQILINPPDKTLPAAIGGLAGLLHVIDGSMVIASNTGSTSSATLTLSQENAWITGSTSLGRYSLAARNNGELGFWNWGVNRDVMRMITGSVMFGYSGYPERQMHTKSPTDLWFRLETTGSSTAAQVEYLRGASYTWLGPTAGNEFHLWSQEDFPFVIGLNNNEVIRFDGDDWWGMPGTTAMSTGVFGFTTDLHGQWHNTQRIFQTESFTFQMMGFPSGFIAVVNTADTTIGASGTYTNMPWYGLGTNTMKLSDFNYVTVDTIGGDTSVRFNVSGKFWLYASMSLEMTAAGSTTYAMCHGYLDDTGNKITGTDMYVTLNNVNDVQTASTFYSRQFTAGDTVTLKISRLLGDATVKCASLGAPTYPTTGAKLVIGHFSMQ